MSYSHFFFDLDRTLWDFDRNSAETLSELYDNHRLEDLLNIDVQSFIQSFREINAQSWREFRKGKESKDELRNNRFVQTFFRFGSGDWKLARQLSREYVETCPHKGNLMPGTIELLEKLSNNNRGIHLITNGFSDTQRIKIKSAGLEKFFDQVVISDETDYRKPDRAIFRHALKLAKAVDKASLMVGDDYEKDIVGAQRAGIDQVHLNPQDRAVSGAAPTYTVSTLWEVSELI